MNERYLIEPGLGKIPPQNPEMEEVVLGNILTVAGAIHTAVEASVTPETFYQDAHGTIYHAAMALYTDSEGIDIATVVNRLRSQGKLEVVGGSYTIAQIVNRIGAGGDMAQYCYILKEYEYKREIIRMARESIQNAYEDDVDIFKVIDEEYQKLNNISSQLQKTKPKALRQLTAEALEKLEKSMEAPSGTAGVPTGFRTMDKVLGGWMDSDLVIIAARPGMGKTAFALCCARNALRAGTPIGFLSLEMTGVQLANRLMSIEASVPLEKIRRAEMNLHDLKNLIKDVNGLNTEDFIIDDSSQINTMELRAKVSSLVKMYGIKLLFVDYIQLMSAPERKNREQEVSEISRTLKSVAKEHNIPVIALSQLSRAVEARGGAKRPMLSDLRESGSLEQDADVVVFLYRPEYYGIKQTEDGQPTAGQCDVIIAKHRNGKTDELALTFIGEYTKFTDYSTSEQIEQYEVGF